VSDGSGGSDSSSDGSALTVLELMPPGPTASAPFSTAPVTLAPTDADPTTSAPRTPAPTTLAAFGYGSDSAKMMQLPVLAPALHHSTI
jgi:hypothetical protein